MLEKFGEAVTEAQLSGQSKPCMEVHLCSGGGDANVALAIYGMMRVSPVEFTVIAMGDVASAAIMILAGGDVRKALKETWFMVHEEQGEINGSVAELEKEAERLRRAETFWADLLAAKTKASAQYWATIHTETTYLDAAEAFELGLIEEIL
jgi:ATP-dependent Clp protease protease subunit